MTSAWSESLDIASIKAISGVRNMYLFFPKPSSHVAICGIRSAIPRSGRGMDAPTLRMTSALLHTLDRLIRVSNNPISFAVFCISTFLYFLLIPLFFLPYMQPTWRLPQSHPEKNSGFRQTFRQFRHRVWRRDPAWNDPKQERKIL